MATHSSILIWRIPWTEEPGRLQSTGHKESDTTEQLHFHFHIQNKKFEKEKKTVNKQNKQGIVRKVLEPSLKQVS